MPSSKSQRTKLEIISSILTVANGGALKTKIMYGAFLTYGQFRVYEPLLLKKGLLEYREDERLFKTTSKGIEFLNSYNTLFELMGNKKEALEASQYL